MSIKPSTAPWADAPYKLIATPYPEKMDEHAAYKTANTMAWAHNYILRGMNTILQQGPYIPDSTQSNYKEKDVKDLLFYTAAWCHSLHHHHSVEEELIFPELEKVAGKPGIAQYLEDQHHAFTPQCAELEKVVKTMSPSDYRWATIHDAIHAFAPQLTEHLNDEIRWLASLHIYDNAGIAKVLQEAEDSAKRNTELALFYDVFPYVLGTCDTTFEGGIPFPGFPAPLTYFVKYWSAAGRNSGPWSFNPCDFWGRPVPLHFVPQGAASVIQPIVAQHVDSSQKPIAPLAMV